MKFVPNAVSVGVARQLLRGRKNSPALLFATGIVAMGATVVLACKATLEVEDVLNSHDEFSDAIDEKLEDLVGYTEKDAKHERVHLNIRTGIELSKLYWPAALCGVVAVSSLTGSHRILSKRNAALTAAYGTMAKAFEDYRGRVREAYGEEREREIYHDAQPCEIEDEKTGKKTTVLRANGGSIYARLFDEHNVNWTPIPEARYVFLKLQQQSANDRLQAKGHLFLNEVYDALGLERSSEGAVVGWVTGKHGKDEFVDFGIFGRDISDRVIDFMTGQENSVWLDFNVDGVIYDKI